MIPGHEPVFFFFFSLLHQPLVYNPPYLALHEYLEYLFIIRFLQAKCYASATGRLTPPSLCDCELSRMARRCPGQAEMPLRNLTYHIFANFTAATLSTWTLVHLHSFIFTSFLFTYFFCCLIFIFNFFLFYFFYHLFFLFIIFILY